MEMPKQPAPQQSRRRPRQARRVTCQDAYHRRLSVGLWAVPSLGVVVLVPPTSESARFSRAQAISLRAVLDEAIAELPAHPA